MALPQTVRVKISSEEAGSITLTEVVVREMPVRELVEYILWTAGKDAARIREVLIRGSFTSGASRLRWAGWPAEEDALRELLAGFPDADPGRAFAPERCVRAVLRGDRQAQEVAREAARRRFWEGLMEIAAAGEPRYAGYSYKYRADRFEVPVGLVPEKAGVRFHVLKLELYVER
jgi:hypothetical protein